MKAPGNNPNGAPASSISPETEGRPASHEALTDAPSRETERFLIVGIGSSAGGLRALEQFFKHMWPDSGMAFIVVQHLPPDRKSEVPHLIRQHTPMNVCEVEDGTLIEPDCVYVIPPSRRLTVQDRRLQLAEPASQRGHSAPIDLFLRSLAEDQKESAAAVILSGHGTDGAAGLRAIKEAGGITLVQAPSDAEHDGMPTSAVGTGLADFVLPVDQLSAKLLELAPGALHHTEASDKLPEDDAAALFSIFSHLRSRTGHDFTHYKRSTVLRRLERRMLVYQVEHLSDYLSILASRTEEVGALLKSLLISVTYFFRDDDAFQALREHIIPRLFREKSDETGLRVWVPGCSTGEEAYTVAILLMEYATNRDIPADFQIFATDIDEYAVDVARNGLYSEAVAADISPERLERFFTWEGEGYRVRKEIREKVLFAVHSLIKDPPFSRIDFISCRNVLIYLNRDVQDQVFDLFHYALRPGGYLFLGMSESADRASSLFATLDKKHHVFQRRAVTRKTPQFSTSVSRMDRPEALSPRKAADRRALSMADLHHRLLLDRYAPPSVIVSDNNDILHITGDAGRYLHIAEGEPTQNILRMIRKELRIELRTSLHQARREEQPVRSGTVPLEMEGEPRQVTFYVTPMADPEGVAGFLQVIFEEIPAASIGLPEAVPTDSDQLMERLEDELLRTKESLQATIEDLERSNEELKASNEELLSTNEELQSTAEELETSQEELQSMNEELVTVNLELKEKVEEVSRSNNDLQNLIISTDIGTIFLDRELRIKRYTPRATDLFNITQQDVGRPLAHFTHRIDYENLLELAERVLNRHTSIEREIHSRDGRWYLVRILPYRTAEDRIDGVVLTFVDMSDRRRAETILSRQQQQIRALVENAPDIIARFDQDFRHVYVNPAVEQFTGMARQNFLGKSNRELEFPEAMCARWEEMLRPVFDTGQEVTGEFDLPRPEGVFHFSARLVPELGADGNVETVLAITRDITDRKRMEDALRDSERRFRLLADSAPVMIWVAGADKKGTWFNRLWLDFTGRTMEQELGDGWEEGVHPEDVDHYLETFSAAFDAREALTIEYRLRRRDGMYRWALDTGVPQFSPEGAFMGYVGSCIDVHDGKELEAKLRQRALQQAVVAELGLTAMEATSLQDLMDLVARRAGEMLETDFCNVYELEADEQSFLLRAGFGWRPGAVGRATVSAKGTLASYAIQSGLPVMVHNFAAETRFVPSQLLREHGAVSSMSVVIGSPAEPYGVLGVHTAEPRIFSQDDQNFLQALANLLGDAVERARTQEELQHVNRALDQRVAERTHELEQANAALTDRIAQLEEMHEALRVAEEALRESERRWRMLVELNPDPIVISSGGRILYSNPAGAFLLGLESPEELVGRSLFDFAPPEDHDKGRERLQVIEGGRSTTPMETRLIRPDGSLLDVETFSTPLMYEGVPAAQTVIRNLTSRKRTEEVIRRSEERFARAFQAAPVAMMITRLGSGRIVDVNDSFEKMTGFARADVIGRTASDIALSVHRILRDRVSDILEQGEGYEDVEARISTRSGDARDVLSSGEVVEFGGETCLLSMFYDITERKRLERAVLEIAEDERRRIGQDLHDGLGQQLTGIAFLSKLLEQNLKAVSSEHAGQMHRIIELLSQAVSYTRNLSRALSPVDVQADGLTDALRRLAESTQEYFDIGCRFETLSEVRIFSNSTATHLYRVVQEAVNNALKHAGAERIDIELAEVDGYGVLRVRDNGCGIPEAESRRAGGMGLRTMQYRSNVIGGTLTLVPTVGGGTTVEVRFPLGPAEE